MCKGLASRILIVYVWPKTTRLNNLFCCNKKQDLFADICTSTRQSISLQIGWARKFREIFFQFNEIFAKHKLKFRMKFVLISRNITQQIIFYLYKKYKQILIITLYQYFVKMSSLFKH